MSIEERANEYCLQERGGCVRELIRSHYVLIATEQREIDIEKACEFIKNLIVSNLGVGDGTIINRDMIDNVLEELTKAMKGE